jgi:solute carrier family 25 citrate transporter 1
MLKQTLAQRGMAGLYAGCSAVVVGNAVKAGVRFTTYDQFKQLLSDDEVRSLSWAHSRKLADR